MTKKSPTTLHTRYLLVPVLLILLSPSWTWAASICGMVTDTQTGDPVPRAGIFLRTATGQYTGDHTATALDGHYCLTGLLAGTYTLEVRVDDYVVFYRTNITVADDISDVPVAAILPAVRLAAPWPNPSAGTTKMRLTVRRRAPALLSVYDTRGRLLRSWNAAALEPGQHDYQWDGTGFDGRPAPSGLYLIQVRSLGQTSTRHLVLTR